MITMYGIPNCDKIKKARIWLEKNNAEYKFYNYKTEGCDEHLANKLLSHFSYKDVLNKRGTTWRKLPENKKSTVDEIAAIELMRSQPSIIVRPIFQIEEKWVIGFSEAVLLKNIMK